MFTFEATPNLSRLRASELKVSEGDYSRSRLRALGDEWSADYPSLLDFAILFNGRPSSFKLSTMTTIEIENHCLQIALDNPSGSDILQQSALRLIDCIVSAEDIKKLLIQIFYKIGLIGIKLFPQETAFWNDLAGRNISANEIDDNISIVIHPAYHRALGIKSSYL